MIKDEDIARVNLDRIRELGESLCLFRHKNGDVERVAKGLVVRNWCVLQVV